MKHADRLDRLKAQLQITQAQEPAWKEFAGSMKQVMTPPAEHAMSHKPGKLQPAPDVLDQHAQRLEDMAQRMKQAAQALRKLYSSLTPKQQAILDTHVADEMHEHRHFAGHHSRSH